MVFANCSNEHAVYSFTVKEIEQAQNEDKVLKKLSKHDKYSTQIGIGKNKSIEWNQIILFNPLNRMKDRILKVSNFLGIYGL